MASKDNVTPLRRSPCPVCRKPANARHQPFCSSRCRDVDLGRWLKGGYSIPTDERPPEEQGADEKE